MRLCSSCGCENADGAFFCTNCGVRLEGGNPPVQAAQVQPEPSNESMDGAKSENEENPSQQPVGEVLLKPAVKMSFFEGQPALGIASANGDLKVYNDRVEFKTTLANALMTMFGGSGKSSKGEPDIYRYQDIKQVRTGKYGVGYNTFVIEMKSGKVVSFVPPLPGSRVPEELRALIEPYIK